MVPGGREGKERQPGGSGSSTLSRESLDEAVLRLQQELGPNPNPNPNPNP